MLSNDVLQGVGTGAAWLVTICLLVAGAVGCVLPILPGHLIILIAVGVMMIDWFFLDVFLIGQ